MNADNVTIYHNPRCSNSRGALALLQDNGITPHVVDYINEPLTVPQLKALVGLMGMPVREVMRSKEVLYQELDLGNEKWSEQQLLEQIAEHPQLLNRPIVVSTKGARLCRPPERVLDLL